MPPLSERIRDFLDMELVEFRDVGGQHGYRHVTGTLADGRSVFAKVAPEPGEAVAAAFAAEANGLRWLGAADGGPPVPQVIGVAGDFLVIELLAPLERPSVATGRRFGADLAKMHAAGAPSFGAPWPGYIASLPLDNHAAETDWGAGTRSAASFRTCGGPTTVARCPARTLAWWKQSCAGSAN